MPSRSPVRPGRTQNVWRSSAVTMGPSLILVAWLVIGSAAAVTLIASGLAAQSYAVRALAAGAVIGVGVWLGLRLWYLGWGATDDEQNRTLPGDDILARPIADMTRAVTVNASAAAVWAWLVQLGQGRGGLFSYDWLENLAGLDIHTLDHIDPQLQKLEVGDQVPLGPGRNNGLVVAHLQPECALILRLCDPNRGGPIDHGRSSYADVSWAFILDPIDSRTTRLISRFRLSGKPRLPFQLAYVLLIEIPHFVMERKMLLGIKARAERNSCA